MYIRVTKVKRDDGKIDEYLRLVESYWNQGSPRHRVICNLGRKEVLAPPFVSSRTLSKWVPIYHQKSDRVQAYVFVASLAFLLDRALEKKLKSVLLDISSKEAWQLLRTVRVVEIDLGNGERKRSVTEGSARPSRILRVLGINDLDPNTRKADHKAA